MKAILVSLVVLVMAAGCAGNAGLGSPGALIPPDVRITVDRAVFRRNETIIVKASFPKPSSCGREERIALRMYDVERLGGGEVADSSGTIQAGEIMPELAYLAAPVQATGFDPSLPVGTKVEVTYAPFVVPGQAGEALYLVVWQDCFVPHTPTERYFQRTYLGGAVYRLNCPGGPGALCGYTRD